MGILGTLTDETVAFIKANEPNDGSPEEMVNVYTLVGVSPYNKVKVYIPMGG